MSPDSAWNACLRLGPALALAALLAGCASTASRAPDSPVAGTGSRPGGYYLDDGPHEDPPPNLDAVPDALPRAEPIRVANTRPYTAMGRAYTPMKALGPYDETGRASWYGKRYHGQPTASGEIYNMYAMTAAHPTLPIPSYAQVTREDGTRSVIVRINDRGPFHADRVIDLSYTAAYKLGMLADGSTRVRVESILPGAAPARGMPVAQPAQPVAVAAPARSEPASAAPAPGVYLQLGAFAGPDNADSFLRRMHAEIPALNGLATVVPGGGLYRVQAGPYATRDQAQQMAERIERILDLKPILLTR
jgi:rare lipoprotein A